MSYSDYSFGLAVLVVAVVVCGCIDQSGERIVVDYEGTNNTNEVVEHGLNGVRPRSKSYVFAESGSVESGGNPGRFTSRAGSVESPPPWSFRPRQSGSAESAPRFVRPLPQSGSMELPPRQRPIRFPQAGSMEVRPQRSRFRSTPEAGSTVRPPQFNDPFR
ncbi:MAG: hypothetical protein KDA88_24550 [Planctomycetaceae bacterium]|nr:hypothetical protein [Planctomycetaceae bacterium]MCB9952330.1 hypothetical protein [Planctomycetaceae bacterium]